MKRRSLLLLLTLALLAANAALFLQRDRFAYHAYSSERALYADPQEWDGLAADLRADDKRAAADELREAGLTTQGRTTEQAVLAITSYLEQRLARNPQGPPSARTLALSDYSAYRYLCQQPGESLQCGTYSRTVLLFCSAAGIRTRYIQLVNPGDDHVFNECFLPETGRWMLVDLSNNQLAARRDGKLLTALEFRRAVQTQMAVTVDRSGPAGTRPEPLDKGARYIRSYYTRRVPYFYYHTLNLESTYSLKNKLERYFLPVSWYEIYTETPGSNAWFFARLTMAVAGMLAVLFLGWTLIRDKHD
ncbi:MAG: hypothetical protein JWP27_98 [Flaviaesturariibacter sp.]|nr:hypothetical protein [Flaviaesturariibacter sp.]